MPLVAVVMGSRSNACVGVAMASGQVLTNGGKQNVRS